MQDVSLYDVLTVLSLRAITKCQSDVAFEPQKGPLEPYSARAAPLLK